VGTDDGECSAMNVALGNVTATDNCTAVADLTITNNAPAIFPMGATTVTWIVEDASGNTTTCEQLVTVVDDVDPVIVCPPDITLQNNDPGLCSATVTVSLPVVSDNCAVANVVNSYNNSTNASGVYPVGTTSVIWTVTDVSGNSAICEQSITVVDVEMPSIVCGEDITVSVDPLSCSAVVTVPSPEVADNCGIAAMVNSYNNTSNATDTYPVGVHTLVWTVTDNSGNQSGCEQIVEVIDNEVPVISCPEDIIVSASVSACNASVIIPEPEYADNCGIASVVNNYTNTSNASGTYPVGTTTVEWTVLDIHGNSSTCSMTVTVVDDIAPAIFCPETITVSSDPGLCEAWVTVISPEIVENCGVLSLINSITGTHDASGLYPVGTTDVVWTVTDINGNANSCTMQITVTDGENPVMVCPENIVTVTDPGSCEAIVSVPQPEVADNCGVAFILNDFNGTSDASGVYPVGTTTVTWIVTDIYGNATECSHVITVSDNEIPSIVCQDNLIVQNDVGLCSANVTVPVPEVADNCGIELLVNDFNNSADASGVYPVGTTLVTWTVIDFSGNTNTCVMQITVFDSEVPQITCPSNIEVPNDAGFCNAAVVIETPVVSDNCGVDALVNSYNNTADASDTYPVGTTEVIWTVTDIHGNSSTCSMNVVVVDLENPQIECPADITEYVNGQSMLFIQVEQPVVSDNCGIESLINDFTGTDDASGYYPVGVTVVTWTVTDRNGLAASCTMRITVIAQEAPEITCPGDIGFITDPGACEAAVTIDQPEIDSPAGIQSIINSFNNTDDASGLYPVGETVVVWTVTDNNDVQAQCQMTVTIIGTPEAVDDYATTALNTAVNVMVMANDRDCDNNLDPSTLMILDNPVSGKLEIDNLAGSITYSPDQDFSGNDQFDYQVCDATGYCAIATVFISITGSENLPPVAIDDYDTTSVGVTRFIPVLENDYDPDGDELTVTLCSEPMNGFVIIQDDQTILYQTNEGISATYDEFCYKICDSGTPSLCDSAYVYITILPDTTGRDIVIYNTITPDSDGQNDYWHIENIEYYENNELSIFNRWGDKILSLKGYNNTSVRWEGKNSKGNKLPEGTYYYIIKLNDVNIQEPYKGWIYLK
ncbi:MAG: HYR domain-containing protein, partial [Bacteroidales bacterium]